MLLRGHTRCVPESLGYYQMKLQRIVLITVIVLFILGAFYLQLSTMPLFRKVEQTSDQNPFSLNDRNARYYLEKLNENFVLYYVKDKNPPVSIYASKDTKIGLEQYLGRDLVVTGRFVKEVDKDIVCIQAPCDPITYTVVRLENIKVK